MLKLERLTDYDFDTYIAFATVAYNSTIGQSGIMGYLGSGTYFLDFDTSGLGLGDYYFSFNASKNYYQNQISIDLIHLKIIAQPLALEVPKTVMSGSGNNYVSCQVNVTGALSGTLIWPVNISTNWLNPYTVTHHNNGTFTLNFSTWNLPTQGVIETYSVSVFASKTYYGNTTSFIAMMVYPIKTIIGVNRSIFVVDLGESVDIKVNYTVEGSEFLILGANLDGIEGNSKAMGALIDNYILLKIINADIDTLKYLENNDSNSFFKMVKSEIITGPTGINVNDILLILILPKEE